MFWRTLCAGKYSVGLLESFFKHDLKRDKCIVGLGWREGHHGWCNEMNRLDQFK